VQVGPSRGPSLAEGNEPARYPLSARRRGQEGTAVVHASIDTEGEVTGARVARSSGVDSIDEAAVAAVRSWRFVPALDQGAPVASEADLPVVFRLRPPSSAGR
jgi:protein TonB